MWTDIWYKMVMWLVMRLRQIIEVFKKRVPIGQVKSKKIRLRCFENCLWHRDSWRIVDLRVGAQKCKQPSTAWLFNEMKLESHKSCSRAKHKHLIAEERKWLSVQHDNASSTTDTIFEHSKPLFEVVSTI